MPKESKGCNNAEVRTGYFFWEYYGFPYLQGGLGHLCSHVEGLPTGRAYIPAYQGTFTPKYVFWDLVAGEYFHNKLRVLAEDYQTSMHLLRNGARVRLATLLQEAPCYSLDFQKDQS